MKGIDKRGALLLKAVPLLSYSVSFTVPIGRKEAEGRKKEKKRQKEKTKAATKLVTECNVT